MPDRSSGKLMSLLPGLGLAVLIAGLSTVLSLLHPTLDPLVLSILVSIILGNLIGMRSALRRGIAFTQEFIVPLGVILYGTQMDLRQLGQHGAGRVLHVILIVLLGMLAIYWLAKRLRVRHKTGMLVAAGSAICGASAIIVLGPVIKAEKDDVSISLLTTTVVGLTGVILYPLVQELVSFSEERYALLCASTLPQMGQVQAAASLLGEGALKLAVSIKLLRVATLLPVAVVLSFLAGREQLKNVHVPWYIAGFLVAAVLVNLVPSFAFYGPAIAPTVKLFFSIAIAGIGLSVDLESIIDAGPHPFLATFLGWLVLIALFFLGAAIIR